MWNRFWTLLFPLSAMILATSPNAKSEQNSIGAFAIGRGGAAAKEAVNVQHRLRELLGTTGLFKQVDIQKLLTGKEQNERQLAQSEALDLLTQGKRAYDELELEQAQTKFQLALKKFEYAYGYLKEPGHMIETMMFLGATFILAGEPEKGLAVFRRVALMPGQKTMDENLFPPNIQEVFKKAQVENHEYKPVNIRISTRPFGAEIYLDDTYRGGSPLNISNITPGIHMVRALKDGFMPWGGKIRIKQGKTNKFRLSPKPMPMRKKYSSLFGRMSAELIRSKPGPSTKKFCDFLKTNRLVVAVLEGEPSSMAIRAYTVETSSGYNFEQHKKVFDIDDPQYSSELKTFLIKLIEPSSDGGSSDTDFDQGARDAAKIVANSENSGEESFGLDLTDEASEAGKKQAPGIEKDKHNKTPEVSATISEKTKASKDTDMEKEQEAQTGQKTDKAQEADEVIKNTSGAKPVIKSKDDADRQFAFTWTYLHDKWWFWTGIGVLAAGAATGTYFAITAGSQQGGGSLVLGLH